MVLLKSDTINNNITSAIKSTFHYGSIKINIIIDIKLNIFNLHSTMVLLKYVDTGEQLASNIYLHSTMVLLKL